MHYVFLVLAFLTGIAISIQAGVNSNLRLALTNPLLASLISFGTGFFTLLMVHLSTGGMVPPMATLRSLAWWKWTGGVIGAVYVTTVILSVPKIGTANLVSLSVAGQLLAAVVLDHYGLLGFTQHPANGWRLLGIGLILAGVWLVVKN
ncbi:DMT family transporter [Fibrella arboris]|uniref:DMT family transporter n=1 Tax=Fibrella arboris TaxID=3242486 RepID=UPI0035206BF4